jgi:hypothetical protein
MRVARFRNCKKRCQLVHRRSHRDPAGKSLAHPESDLVSGEALVRWLELSGKEVCDLRKAGVLVRDRQRFGLRERAALL